MKFAVAGDLSERPEVRAVAKRHRLACVGLWTMCGAWSAGSHEPGFVPLDIVKRWDRRSSRPSRLADAGLWVDDICPHGEVGFQLVTRARLCQFVAETPDDAGALRRYNQRRREQSGERRRRPIPWEVRQAVYDRDGWTCVGCGATVELTLDHVWPWSLGGSDDEDNLQTLCRPCNSAKGARV